MTDVARNPLVGALLGVARAGRRACFSAYHAAAGLNYATELHPSKKRVPGGWFRSFELFNIHGRDPLLRRLLADCVPGETVYDVGAHTGVYALSIGAVKPACTVFAFEPNPDVCDRLRANVRINGFADRIEVRECGLAAQSEIRSFHRASYPELGSFNRYNATRWDSTVSETIPVAAWALDDLLCDGAPPPDRLKIDVEGFGLEVLSGADETIATHRPAVYLEVHPTEVGRRESALREFFAERDYRVESSADAWVCTPAER